MEENLKQQHTNKIKIAFYGPESTGKSTIAKQLAEKFKGDLIPEFAREYLQKKWNDSKEICEPKDLLPIAVGQMKLENEALQTNSTYLFADTNLMCTKVFSEIYYNYCDPVLDKFAKIHTYDLFFLTNIDVPFEQDDLRDKPNEREMLFATFEKALINNNKPYLILSGNAQERLKEATIIIQEFTKAKAANFSSFDFIQMYNQGIKIDTVVKCLDIYSNGIPKTVLEKSASTQNGILQITEQQAAYFASVFDSKKENLKLQKFVPASGAATRMFKFLSEFLNDFKLGEETINAYINRTNSAALLVFLVGKDKFPFYKAIKKFNLKKYPKYKSWDSDKQSYYFIKALLDNEDFNFASKPKAVLPFHKYKNHNATPIEEHLKESSLYASSQQEANLHFTISEEHQSEFEAVLQSVKNKIEQKNNIQIKVKYSYQHKSTDTLAVDLDNNPFRTDDGKLFFRPGGHGALIENLNELNADIIFIKNIDNIVQNQVEIVTLYKKALAGILLELQKKAHDFLNLLESENQKMDALIDIVEFVKTKLNIVISKEFQKYTKENKILYLFEILNRPMRICGMVKNEGEPGGGPFWVKDSNGNIALQIVETSQVDIQNQNQRKILRSSTHFNPVDLVCSTKNYKAEKFNLTEFVDYESGFIVEKTKKGKPIKAYELPGLWNGAMAKWITVFVEVPLTTFNPVKTVNDLLKAPHQPQ